MFFVVVLLFVFLIFKLKDNGNDRAPANDLLIVYGGPLESAITTWYSSKSYR